MGFFKHLVIGVSNLPLPYKSTIFSSLIGSLFVPINEVMFSGHYLSIFMTSFSHEAAKFIVSTSNDNCITASSWRIRATGPLKYFWGIEATCSPTGLFLCQGKYVLGILSTSGMLRAKPLSFLIEQNLKLTFDSESPLQILHNFLGWLGISFTLPLLVRTLLMQFVSWVNSCRILVRDIRRLPYDCCVIWNCLSWAILLLVRKLSQTKGILGFWLGWLSNNAQIC